MYLNFVSNNRTALFQIVTSDQLGSYETCLSGDPPISSATEATKRAPKGTVAESTAGGVDAMLGTELGPHTPGPPQKSEDTPSTTLSTRVPSASASTFSSVNLWFSEEPKRIELNCRPYIDDPMWLSRPATNNYRARAPL